MKAVTAAEMREIDRISIEEYSIPAMVLMNNAGKSVADFIIHNYKVKETDIFCGTGNNGGDGFAAAYYLKLYGSDPVIYISGDKDRITDVSLVFLNICVKLLIPVFYISESNIDSISIREGSIVLDALTGTGFEGSLRGASLSIVKLINNSSSVVVSADIPSGLPADGDVPEGEIVRADYTITMGLPKISLVTCPGREYCGGVIVADIGFPSVLTKSGSLKTELIDEEFVRRINLCPESDDIHKGDKGNTLIIGGLQGMEGAAMLTASAMFKTGAGLVTLAATDESRKIIAGKIPELMTADLPVKTDDDSVLKFLMQKKYSLLIIGPGMGRDLYSGELFSSVVRKASSAGIKNMIIDGDGLFHLGAFLKENRLPDNLSLIITPHFMEASRITGRSVEDLKTNRLKTCKELADYAGCIAVLKGPGTVVSDGVNACINTTGNRGLATAGSGDILAGIIGAIAGRGVPSFQAACAGVYYHGLSADIYAAENPVDSMSSSDLLNHIRPALSRLSQ